SPHRRCGATRPETLLRRNGRRTCRAIRQDTALCRISTLHGSDLFRNCASQKHNFSLRKAADAPGSARNPCSSDWGATLGGAESLNYCVNGLIGTSLAIPRTVSKRRATSSSAQSLIGGPTICSPTGSPARVNPHGSDSAGQRVNVIA